MHHVCIGSNTQRGNSRKQNKGRRNAGTENIITEPKAQTGFRIIPDC